MIISFSTFPLYFAIYSGIVFAMFGVIYGIWVIFNVVFNVHYATAGWPSIVVLILFIGGLIMFLIGVIGVYIAKLFVEVKGRPRYIINRKIGNFSR